jgi:cobalt/nickel transport system ATP-binding protein
MVLNLCQRVIVLDKGKIVSSGPTKEILSDYTILEPHGLEVPLSLKLKI